MAIKAQSIRVAGKYSYCPNHILGKMNNALLLDSLWHLTKVHDTFIPSRSVGLQYYGHCCEWGVVYH